MRRLGNGGLAAIETAHRLVAGAVLAVGEPNLALMREAKRAGAREYLDINNLRHDLAAALATIETAMPTASKRGQVITVFSPVSGVGVSTIALNLAVTLAKQRPQAGGNSTALQSAIKRSAFQDEGAVSLVDLTPPPSDLSLLLDMDPRHTLAEVFHEHERLDGRLLAGAMTPHESGLARAAPGRFHGRYPRAGIRPAAPACAADVHSLADGLRVRRGRSGPRLFRAPRSRPSGSPT